MKTSIESKNNDYEHHTEELEIARQMIQDEENAFDQTAPNAEQENREAEEEGIKDRNFCIFQSRVVEQRHYDIGRTTVHLLSITSRNNWHNVTR